MLTVTIDRTSLTLPALVITGSRTTTPSGIWIPAGGYTPPTFAPRYTRAADSAWIGGKTLLSVVLDQGLLPLTIRLRGANEADLTAKKGVLEQALAQFHFIVTVDHDGEVRTWQADFSWPSWTAVDEAMRVNHDARAQVSIPVNP